MGGHTRRGPRTPRRSPRAEADSRIYVARELADQLFRTNSRRCSLTKVPTFLGATPSLVGPALPECTLFWIPALRKLAADVADEAEVQADDAAARERPLALASAILALAGWGQPYPALDDTVGFAQRGSLLDRRIRRLAGEKPPVESHVTRKSVVGALLALALVWSSGAIMAHPLPTAGDSHHLRHCEHPGDWPVSHLVCYPDALWTRGDVCPHARLDVSTRGPR